MLKKVFLILFFIVAIIVTFISFRLERLSDKVVEEEEGPEFKFVKYEGFVSIEHDIYTSNCERDDPSALNGASKDSIISFRLNKVKMYAQLNFFPPSYHPFLYSHKRIYGSITPYKDWVSSVVYYIANPYLLVVAAPADYVNPINLTANDPYITYENGVIKESHMGRDAEKWLDCVFAEGEKYAGKVWLVMVNAVDAGFRYGYVDVTECKNVERSSSINNITNKVHEPQYRYHVGKYNKNNLSPGDPEAWIGLKEKTETKIYIKLWRERPESVNNASDIAYIIEVSP
jgi:hypothetical protein